MNVRTELTLALPKAVVEARQAASVAYRVVSAAEQAARATDIASSVHTACTSVIWHKLAFCRTRQTPTVLPSKGPYLGRAADSVQAVTNVPESGWAS